MSGLRVGIFGATGAVGKELIAVLTDRNFPVGSLRLFASERSEGKTVETKYGKITVENANGTEFSGLDLCLFAIGGGWTREFAQKATTAGAYVIDNSSTFRYDPGIPLVIPEINADAIGSSLLIANPNCTTAIAIIPLEAIRKRFGLRKVIMSTYQASSGAGAEGMEELKNETKRFFENGVAGNKVFAYPLPFNVIPHIDVFQDNGYTKEEMKVVWETRKILRLPDLAVSATCVRVPVLRAHSEAITVETEKPADPFEVWEIMKATDMVELRDDTANKVYPMPISASGKYPVEVGRIRRNLVFGEYGIDFFVSGDQLLRGAALNAVLIAEALIAQGKLSPAGGLRRSAMAAAGA
jgi:aspartate-semialdehyde dehydrogenase